MLRAIDTHAHLNDPRLLPHLDAVLARAHEAGVGGIIVVGWEVETSERAVRLAQEHPNLWATVGIHPHHAKETRPEHLRRLRELAGAPRVVAIGETGLDFYRDLSPRPVQGDIFQWHLALAAEVGLPVMLHCRSAQEELLEILAAHPQLRSAWHCFDGTPAQAGRAVALGAHLGFGGRITYQKQDDLRRALAAAPRERVLLETDAPYLSPEPHRSKDNEPANVVAIGAYAAHVRGESPDVLLAATTENACRFFALELPDG